jgi:hypothetical protein
MCLDIVGNHGILASAYILAYIWYFFLDAAWHMISTVYEQEKSTLYTLHKEKRIRPARKIASYFSFEY